MTAQPATTCHRAIFDPHWCTAHGSDFADGATACEADRDRRASYRSDPGPTVLWTPAGPAYATRRSTDGVER